jgi:hypothetical protein
MMSQRRFHDYLNLSLICGLGFFGMVGIGAFAFGTIEAVAVAATACYLWASPFGFWAAMRHDRGPAVYFTELYRPFIAGAIAGLPGVLLLSVLGKGFVFDVAAIAVVPTTFVVCYLLLLMRLAPTDFYDLLAQISPLIKRFLPQSPENKLSP